MIYLELIGESKNSHFLINIDQVFNVIFGDSATGKTLMYNLSNKAKCKTLKTNASNIIPYVPGISINYLEPNSIVIIESDNITIDDIKGILKSNRTDIYIIYLGRKYLRNIPISVDDLYVFKTVRGITKNIKYSFSEMLLKEYNHVLVEDDCSGYEFFHNIFGYQSNSSHGNSNIISLMKRNDLVIFDSIGFGGYIEEFLDIVYRENIAYLGYESFEGFLLRELFNDNRKATGFNKEECLLKMVKEYNPNYTKHSGCTQEYCYKCNNDCNTSSIDLLKNSSYGIILNYFKRTKSILDSIVESAKR